jgi:hypothetical protein
MLAHRRGGGLGEGAALVYLHDTDDRQRIIAAAVSDLAGGKRPARCITGDLPEEGSGTWGLISMSEVFPGGAEGLEPRTPARK